MTIDVADRVRRAIDDIVDAAGDLGPCPRRGAEHVTLRGHPRADARSGSASAGRRTGASHVQRWAAVAAGLLVVVGTAAVTLVVQGRDSSTTTLTGSVDLGPLDRFPVGSIVFVEDPPLFVVNDAAAGIIVFDARSTHLGCVLVLNDTAADVSARAPNSADVEFIDPCHGSRFDSGGNKLAGPAPRSMDSYRFGITDRRLVVDLTQPIPGDPAPTPGYSAADLDLTLPLVSRSWASSMDFSLDREVNARLFNASQIALANCMRARGFADYQAATYPDNGGFEDLINPLDRRYATVMGYHDLPAEPVDPNTLTEESSIAAGECGNVVFDETWGRFSDYWSVNDQLRNGIATAIAEFPESGAGRAARAEWQACMAERGHDFRSRDDAIRAYADRPTVTSREIDTRLDDLDCDIAVGYTERQHDWEGARIDTWRADNADTIAIAIEQKLLLEGQLSALEADVRTSQG